MKEPGSTLSMKVSIDDGTRHNHRPDEIVSYRWDRIIAAVLVLGLLSGAIVYGAWYALAPSTQQPLFAPVRVIVPVEQSRPEKAAKVVPPRVVPVKEAPGETGNNDDPASPATQSPSQPPIVAATPASVRILSDKLVRARLTRNVVNQEPVGLASALIPMNARGLIRVYMFTEMQGLKGKTIHHDWFLNDQRMARVTMRPRSEHATASSSKFIDQHMRGDWRVEITTGQGRLLARSEFGVR